MTDVWPALALDANVLDAAEATAAAGALGSVVDSCRRLNVASNRLRWMMTMHVALNVNHRERCVDDQRVDLDDELALAVCGGHLAAVEAMCSDGEKERAVALLVRIDDAIGEA